MPIQQKIDEWIKEAEERPASAMTILRLIAGRLAELSARDEELLAENIALQDGSRVEEYRKRIAHLEYQLDLLKRRFGPGAAAAIETSEKPSTPIAINLLLYHPNGRVLRLDLPIDANASTLKTFGQLTGEWTPGNELPRLIAVSADEEVLLLFSTGRVSTYPVTEIPVIPQDVRNELDWGAGALPDEPHAANLAATLGLHHPGQSTWLRKKNNGLHGRDDPIQPFHWSGYRTKG